MPFRQESTCIPSAANVSWTKLDTALLSSICRTKSCDVLGRGLVVTTFFLSFRGSEKRCRLRFRTADLVLSKSLCRLVYQGDKVLMVLEAKQTRRRSNRSSGILEGAFNQTLLVIQYALPKGKAFLRVILAFLVVLD